MNNTPQKKTSKSSNELDNRVERLQKLLRKIKADYYSTLQQTEFLRKKATQEQWTSKLYQECLRNILNGKNTVQSYREHQEILIQEYEHQLTELLHRNLSLEMASYQPQNPFREFQENLKQNMGQVQHYLLEQKVPHFAGLILLIVALGFFTYTGYASKDSSLPQTILLETTFSQNTTLPLNITDLNSLRTSGRIIGKPGVHIYLETENDKTRKTQRSLILDGNRLELDPITANVVRQNQGIPFVLTTDQETYITGEMIYVILAPSDSYYSLYLTDPDNNTFPIDDGLNFTVQKAGTYQLVGLLTQDSVSERLQTTFQVKEGTLAVNATPIFTEKPKGLYPFQNHCEESCHLPENLIRPKLVLEMEAGTRITLYNLTYTQHTTLQPPKQVKKIPDSMSYLGYSTTIDLNSYFQDDDELTYQASTTELAIGIENGILTLQGNKTGSYSLFIYVNDGSQIMTSTPFTVTVQAPPLKTDLALSCAACKPKHTLSYTETRIDVTIQKTSDKKIETFYIDLPAGWRITDAKDGSVNVVDEKHPRIQWTLKKEGDTIEKNFYALAPTTQKKIHQVFTLAVGDQQQEHEVIVHPNPIDLEEERNELEGRLGANASLNARGENYTVQLQIQGANILLENVYDLEEIKQLDYLTPQNITIANQIYLAATPLLYLNPLQLSNATLTLTQTTPIERLAQCERWNFETKNCNAWNFFNTTFYINTDSSTFSFTAANLTAYAGLGRKIGEIKSRYRTSKIGEYTNYILNNETYANYTPEVLYPGQGSFSAEFWIRTPSTQDQTFLSSGEGKTDRYWKIGMDIAQQGILSIRFSSNESNEIKEIPDALVEGPQSFGTTSLNDGQWHHILAVRDRSQHQVRGYVDGKLDLFYNDTSTDITDLADHLVLGMSNPNSDIGYDGELTLVNIYPYTLNSEEAQNHYENQKPTFTEVKR